MRLWLRFLLAATVSILIPACGSKDGRTIIQIAPSTVTVNSISASPAAVAPGGSVALSASATDSAGGILTFTWSAAFGSLSSATGPAVDWTAPGTTGNYVINLAVTSSSGGSGVAIVGVLVSSNPSGTTITLDSIAATPPSVPPGGGVVLTASVTYAGAGTLTYSWSAVAGTLSTATGSPVTWTAPGAAGSYLVNLTVTDGLGASASGVAGVLVYQSPDGSVITSIIPAEASIGDEIQVTGSGFGAVQGPSSLTLSGQTATVLEWSDNLIRAIVPVGARTGTVLVTMSGGQSSPGHLVIVWSTTNPQNRALCTALGHQDNPRIVSDGSDGAIVAWTDPRAGAANFDIYVQRVNNAGQVQWASDGVAICTAAGNQWNPYLVSDGSGGAIIVWKDRRNGTNFDLYAQRVDASGAVQWTTNGVAICTAAGNQEECEITSGGPGGAIIAWVDARSGAGQIYAQLVNDAGVVQWAVDGVAICTAGGQGIPRVLPDGSGGALLAWEDGRSGTDVDIYAQRVNAAGATQWASNGVPISVGTASQWDPRMDSDGAGGVILAWTDQRNASNDIYAQRINGAGVVQWTVNGIAVCTATNNQVGPQPVSDGAGGVIIAWHDARSGATNDIYAQRVSDAGVTQWAVDGLSLTTGTVGISYFQVAPDDLGGLIAVWRDIRNGNYDLYAQRVNGQGVKQWADEGVALCTAPNDQYSPQIVADGTSGAVVVWTDHRSGLSLDVYAQGVSASGLQ